MEKVIAVFQKLPEIIGALDAILLALIALFILIPGDQPEKSIRKIADFIGKFSRKPKV